MATVKLSDDREFQQMTPAEADTLFNRIAVLETNISRLVAEGNSKVSVLKQKIADIKKDIDDRTAADKEEYKILVARLKAYVSLHRRRFISPRQRKTPFGRYGLHAFTETQITDAQFVMAFSDEHQLNLYETTRIIDNNAVTKAITELGEVPGAQIVSGDAFRYTVFKTVPDLQSEQ